MKPDFLLRCSPSGALITHYDVFQSQYILILPSQDVAAYRAKGKTGGAAPGKAPAKAEKKDDDDDDEDEDEEEEEDYDDDDDE